MVLPNFLCVGTQKAGTTSLHNILKQHPDICLSSTKETKYFIDDKKYQQGIRYYETMFFNHYKGEKAVGEIDPDYMFVPFVPERIYKSLSREIKLIFILRDPIDRAISHYWMNFRKGFENADIQKAFKREFVNTGADNDIFYNKRFSYISRGYYATQIKRFLDFFPIKNMLFIIFESDFRTRLQVTITTILNFLKLESKDLDLEIKNNVTSLPKHELLRNILYNDGLIKKLMRCLVPSKMRGKLMFHLKKINEKPFKPDAFDRSYKRDLLHEYFIDEITELERIIKRDLSMWYTF